VNDTVTVRREDNALRVLENKKLRRIFGPSGEKVKGGWKNHTLCNFIINAVMKFCYDEGGWGIGRTCITPEGNERISRKGTAMTEGKSGCYDSGCRERFMAACCECGNEPLSFFDGGNILD
jgi:hypothetical protein